MPKFRKKPVVIEAVQMAHSEMGANGPLDPLFRQAAPSWLREAIEREEVVLSTRGARDYAVLEIRTREGVMEATPDDWIIRGVAGELYPCKPEIFDATYDAVKEPETVPA